MRCNQLTTTKKQPDLAHEKLMTQPESMPKLYTGEACLVCGKTEFGDKFSGEIINGHSLRKCISCGMVQATACAETSSADYSNYGSYLLVTPKHIGRRIQYARNNAKRWFRLVANKFPEPVILDYGSGAGFLCKAAEQSGLKAYGLEPSRLLIQYCKEHVNFHNLLERIEDLPGPVSAVFMTDVIEHLPPSVSRELMGEVVSRISPGGFLIGNTPNIDSFNILLHKCSDPAVAPPSHVCYFNLSTLHAYLTSLGLNRVSLYSTGVSTNSFFRRKKFERSFVETGLRSASLPMLPVLLSIRGLFWLGGHVARCFKMGYQIYFAYQKPNE
jgi:2-polyprenyl-3-methyl-5-hydroxy-6-metoxy-1,4-benzoquinol methylase